MSEHASFVVAETALAAPPLVPEIRLYLASEITPLWQATEARLAETNTPPPYWAFAWPGGQAIARQLLDEPALVAGRRVLDFAAGSGLAAIAAAKAGASAVEAAEIDPLAGAAIALNAAANGVAVAWRKADLVGSDERWDVVLAGDVCYERPMAERVMPWLRRLAAEGCLVLMGDPGRSYLPDRGLARLASHVVPISRELEDRTERETVIWRVLP
jgi:predicted nicotinamide N-methyase